MVRLRFNGFFSPRYGLTECLPSAIMIAWIFCLPLCLPAQQPAPNVSTTPLAQAEAAPNDTRPNGSTAANMPTAEPPHVVVLISEPEYRTNESLPRFVRTQLEPRGLRCTVLQGEPPDENRFPGMEAVQSADLLFISVRRRALPTEQLARIRAHVAAHKPLVGIRTANHAFDTRGKRPEGHAEWPEFDAHVWGGNYHGHHGAGPVSRLEVAPAAAAHPILQGISPASFVSHGSLYKVSPLANNTTPLLIGRIPNQPPEPVAWTHTPGPRRAFYTSMGHIQDFDNPQFQRLLTQAVFWALARPISEPRVD
jgi:type 1 glutamine amidotransferase